MIFLLHFGEMKCRFHGIRHRKLNIPSFIDVLGSGSAYFFILLDQNTLKKPRKSGNIPGKNGKTFFRENLKLKNSDIPEIPETSTVQFLNF